MKKTMVAKMYKKFLKLLITIKKDGVSEKIYF